MLAGWSLLPTLKGRSPKAVAAATWQVCGHLVFSHPEHESARGRLAIGFTSYWEAAGPCPRVSSVIFTPAVAARHS